jgi:hypothetical protein
MTTAVAPVHHVKWHPVELYVEPRFASRDRRSCAFRLVLAFPHLLLVGGPIALVISWSARPEGGGPELGAGGGALGAVAALIAVIAWFAILFTGRYPVGLWRVVALYLRWRVRAVAYVALLRDEFPPFGDGSYAVAVSLEPPVGPRDRLSVAFRLLLALPHLVAVCVLGFGWAVATLAAWFSILFTGRYPEELYRFSVGVLRWTTRVEAYLLLLHDDYPPFSLD